MHSKCPQELSIADRTRLECSRNVPNFSYVIDHDVIIPPYVDFSNVLTWRRQSSSQRATKKKGTPRCSSQRSSWRASWCSWRCSGTFTVGSWSHGPSPCFPDGHSGRGKSASSIIVLLYFIALMFSFWRFCWNCNHRLRVLSLLKTGHCLHKNMVLCLIFFAFSASCTVLLWQWWWASCKWGYQ